MNSDSRSPEDYAQADPGKLAGLLDSDLGNVPTISPDATPSSAPQLDLPGYRLVREISRGGQAIVYEGVQSSTGQRVAIKILKEGVLSSPAEQARFDREAQLLVALQHPDIVRILDRGTTESGVRFLVMEYIHGRPLDEFVEMQRRESGDPSNLLRLFLRIAEAVNAAHLRGIVHRDLKPANIRIDPNGNPHILDFGLARTALTTDSDRNVTLDGQFIGSLPWASPEQADGLADKIDCRSDVYSLGVILYQMLTGAFPYEVAGTMRDVLNNILTAQPAPPSEVLAARAAREAQAASRAMKLKRHYPATINPAVEAIVLKALSKRRDDRYQSAGEMARDIAAYLSGHPTSASAAPARRVPAWVWPAVAAVVAIGLTVVALRYLESARSMDGALPEEVASMNAPSTPEDAAAPPVEAPADVAAEAPAGPISFKRVGKLLSITGTDGPDAISLRVRSGAIVVRGQGVNEMLATDDLAGVVIETGGGDDQIDLDEMGALTIELDTGAGSDCVRFGVATASTAGFAGHLKINGGEDGGSVQINDADNATPDTYTIDGQQIGRGKMHIDVESISEIRLVGGQSPGRERQWTYNIAATHKDIRYALTAGDRSSIVLGASDGESKGNAAHLRGPVEVEATGGCVITLVDDGRSEKTTYAFDGSTLSRTAAAPIVLQGGFTGKLILRAGRAPAIFNLDASPAGGVEIVADAASANLVNISKASGNIDASVGEIVCATGGQIAIFDAAADPETAYEVAAGRIVARRCGAERAIVWKYPEKSQVALHAPAKASVRVASWTEAAAPLAVFAPDTIRIDTAAGVTPPRRAESQQTVSLPRTVTGGGIAYELFGGVLTIVGTDKSDAIAVASADEHLELSLGSDRARIALQGIESICIDAGDGDDQVSLDTLFDIAADVRLGGGDDTLTLAAESGQLVSLRRGIKIDGGEGNDALDLNDTHAAVEVTSFTITSGRIARNLTGAVGYAGMESVSVRSTTQSIAGYAAGEMGTTWWIASTRAGTTYKLDNGTMPATAMLGWLEQWKPTHIDDLAGPLRIGRPGTNFVNVKLNDADRSEEATYEITRERVARKGMNEFVFERTDGLMELNLGKPAATINIESQSGNGGLRISGPEAECTVNICAGTRNMDALASVSGVYLDLPGTVHVYDDQSQQRRYELYCNREFKHWGIALAHVNNEYHTTGVVFESKHSNRIIWHAGRYSKLIVQEMPDADVSVDVVAADDLEVDRRVPSESVKVVRPPTG